MLFIYQAPIDLEIAGKQCVKSKKKKRRARLTSMHEHAVDSCCLSRACRTVGARVRSGLCENSVCETLK